MQLPAYPAALEESEWKKHKGIVAKAVPNQKVTGIGEALKALKTEYGLLQNQFSSVTGKPDQDQKRDAKFYEQKVKGIAELAGATAADWKKSSLIPASSRKYAEQVQAAAKKHATDIFNACLK